MLVGFFALFPLGLVFGLIGFLGGCFFILLAALAT